MSQLTKEQLSDRIRTVLTHEIKAFLDQSSPEEADYQAKIEEAKAKAAAETVKVVADAWKQQAKQLEAERPDSSVARRRDAALAVMIVTNALRLPLELKGSPAVVAKPAGKAQKGEGKRMPRAVMQKLAANLLAAFPTNGTWIKISQLAETVEAEISDVRSALLRLKRENKAESNGQKGKGGAWKRK